MSKKRKIPWFNLLRLFGIIAFIIIVINIDIKSAWEVLKTSNGIYILIAVVFQIFLLLVKSYRWYLIRKTENDGLSFFRSSAIFLESYAIGVITPGRVGEFMKAGHENNKTDKVSSIIKIFFERGFDLGLFFLIGGLFLFYFFGESSFSIGVFFVLGGMGLLIVSFLLMTSQKTRQLFIYGLNKVGVKSVNSMSISYGIQRTSIIFVSSMLTNLFYFFSGYFLALSVKIIDSFLTISGTISITGIINLLPISIMGMGTREASFLYFLSDHGQGQIFAFSILMFLVAQIGGAIIALLLSQILFINQKKKING